jgi:hypothetical protein
MTTLATVLGLLPMALGIGEGSETNLPLARAVIGGLTVSTFFTLFLVPARGLRRRGLAGHPGASPRGLLLPRQGRTTPDPLPADRR